MDRDALVQAILDLHAGHPGRVPDARLAHRAAMHVKPYVDRLSRLEADPGERDDDGVTIGSLAAEAEAVGPPPGQEDKKRRRRRPTGRTRPGGSPPDLPSATPEERARWIFLDRFVPLDRLQQIVGYEMEEGDVRGHVEALDRLLSRLLTLPEVVGAAERNDVPSLQKLFASSLLLLRNPFLGNEEGDPVPCTLESLRSRFPDYFYRRSHTPNWYESYPFYTQSMGSARWALCELEYLNCTLRGPRPKLGAYARRWRVAPEEVVQKTVLEDVYDRIVCGEAVGDDLFEQNCNSCTATAYRTGSRQPVRAVYTVQRHRKVAIHGKPGIPHWRATRRLWPGVFPCLMAP